MRKKFEDGLAKFVPHAAPESYTCVSNVSIKTKDICIDVVVE